MRRDVQRRLSVRERVFREDCPLLPCPDWSVMSSGVLTALCCCCLEHQTREGVVPEVHEDLHRHPQETQSSVQVTHSHTNTQTHSVPATHEVVLIPLIIL